MIRRALRALARRAVQGAPTIPAERPSGRARPTQGMVPPPAPEEPEEEGAEVEVEATELARWLREEGRQPLLLDIREEQELWGGVAEGAFVMRMGLVPQRMAELPRDQDIVVYCAAGARSYGVAHYLREHGFERAWSLAEGFGGWIEIGGAWFQPPSDAPFRVGRPVLVTAEACAAAGESVEGDTTGWVQAAARAAEGGWRFDVRISPSGGPSTLLKDLPETALRAPPSPPGAGRTG